MQSGVTAALVGLTLSGGKGGGLISGTGGAIQNVGTLTLKNCTLTGNSAAFDGNNGTGLGGAIYNDGTLTVTGCTFTGNATFRTGAGDTTPIFDETTGSGGAIYNPAGKSLTVTNSTFFNNTSVLDGGAIASRGTVAVTHSTFAGNTASVGGYGGGIAIRGGTLSLGYSVIAGNAAVSGPDLYKHPTSVGVGAITPVGTNLIGKNHSVTEEFPQGSLVGVAASPVVANLSALGNNGGLTQTMLPLPGSLAIDAATGSTVTTDQCGNARPTDGDGNGSVVADLGAVERGTLLLPVVTTTADSGPGSLRQAFVDADAATYATITFAPGFTGPIVVACEIAVPSYVEITVDVSNVAGGLVLSGGGTNRIFAVNIGASLTLKGVTLTGGNSTGTDVNGNGSGGAIDNFGTLALTQCTLSGNSADLDGGAIFNYGTLTLTQCTLSGNSAASSGGAIANYRELTLTQCTLSGNSAASSGGAIANLGGALTLKNTIVAWNTAPTGPDIFNDSVVTITANGNNVIGRNDTVETEFPAGPLVGTSASPVDAKLSPLGNYGGPTQTMFPLAGSPAINAGDNAAIPAGITNDQRGSFLPFNATVDIGAVERGRVVSNTNGTGTGSLRNMVLNAGTGGVVINFDPSLNGQTITLSEEIELNKNLEINAGGLPNGITVNGGSNKFRLFHVLGGKTVALHNLKLINGGNANYNTFGGAIVNEGNLSLTRCTLSGNKVASGNSGGAISSSLGSTLSLTDCTLSGNTADFGGAIVTVGTATLNRCTLNGNTARAGNGGAISGNMSTVSLTQCTVAGNTATGGAGGGIYCQSSMLTMIHCTIAGNTTNTNGGGVYADGQGLGAFAIANTIIAGNTAPGTGPDFFESGNVTANVRFTGRVFIGALGGNGFSVSSTVLTGNAMLSPLGDYGGPTQTMVPLAGSPVRDNADSIGHVGPALNVDFPTDQRGSRRALDSNNNSTEVADLGAAESGNGPLQDYCLWSQSVTSFPAGAAADQRGAAADYDGDGQSNYSEWLAQTSPNNGASRFEVIQTRIIGPDLVISLNTSTGRRYSLLQQVGTSSAIIVESIIGNGTLQSLTTPISLGTRILKVEVSLP